MMKYFYYFLTTLVQVDTANVDGAESYGGDGTSIDYYLATAFNNNKSDFLVFEYVFNKKNNNYYIVDFKVRWFRRWCYEY